MKKFLALVALVAVALTACDKGSTEQTFTSTIELYSNEVVIAKGGGEKIVEFKLNNGQGGKVTAEADAEWLEARVEFNAEVVITAQANEGDAREAKVTVKYQGAKDAVITVKQKAGNVEFDEEFAAKRFEGQYFGSGNYFVTLSDIGLAKDGSHKANGTYYIFDFYGNTPSDEEYPMLPNGTYTFDAANTGANGTFSDENSWYGVTNAAGEYATARSYKTATVTVEDGVFEALIEFNNGEVHRVVYEGDLTAVLDDTTLSADTTIAIEGAEIVATNYGDLYEVGMQNWYIEVKKDDKVILLDVFSASTTDPSGVYQVLSGAEYANKFIPGFMDGSELVGAWYGSVSNGKFKVIAPMVDGVIKIEVLGNTATIDFGVWDDGGNLIDGSASGAYSVGKAEE
ncbi:MAG: BACON domain-containing protein [Alistipes sp.]|nr:BACON domain-containing protein [Alistipes sp.]